MSECVCVCVCVCVTIPTRIVKHDFFYIVESGLLSP